MFDNAAKSLWFGDTIRRSLLDPKPTKRPDEEEGGAVPSQKTRQAMEAFFAAQEAGDADELPRRLNEVVRSWRADNAAGGVPVYGHLPLPSQFATHLVNTVDGLLDQSRDAVRSNLLSRTERGAGLAVVKQLEVHPSAERNNRSTDAGAFISITAQTEGKFGPPWAYEEDERVLENSRDHGASRQTNSAYAVQPRFKPPAPPAPVPLNGYRPGDWARHNDPRTSRGTKLVSLGALSKQQQDNLRQRNWIHPTGVRQGRERLIKGWGFFGSAREKGGAAYFHGGYDAPGKEVLLPTKATFVGYDPKGRIAKFDLGNGLTLELLHIDASRQIQQLRPGVVLDAGVYLGTVESQEDHVHIQIRAVGPGSDPWVVDPTPFIEKRARTFWRRPMMDEVEDIIDIFAADPF